MASAAISTGCELVAGIKDRDVYAEPSSQGGSGGASGQGGSGGGSGQAGAGQGGASAGQAGQAGQAGTSGMGGEGGMAGMAGIGGSAGASGEGGAAGMSGAAGSGGAPSPVCQLPAKGATSMRVANLVPGIDRVSVCLKPKASADYSQVAPLLKGNGKDCPAGLSYKQVSAAFEVTAGIYDVKYISDAAPDCTDPGIATLENVVVQAGATTDTYLLGDASARIVSRFVETKPQPVNTAFRFLVAVPGLTVDVGAAASTTPPQPLLMKVFSGATYNALQTASALGTVDANGYLQINVNGSIINMAVADQGQSTGRMIKPVKFDSNTVKSMFVVGSPSDPAFPEELVLCEELTNDEGAPHLAKCNGGTTFAQPLSVGTLNAQLTGIFAVALEERKPEISKAIAAEDTDVLCVGEVWDPADKAAIIDAVKAKYPYQVSIPSDVDTPIDDPTDQSGKVPPPYTTPACTGDGAKALDKLISCLQTKCAETPGDPNTPVKAGTCASDPSGCQLEFASLLVDFPCFSCALTQVQSFQPLSEAQTNCENDPKTRFAFKGNNGALLLSRKKLSNPSLHMLPSTEWRVGVLRAEASIENGATVDVYCTTLTTPADSFTRPYVGQYGAGMTGLAGWNAENLLQVQRLEKLVGESSKYRRAVVLGEMYAGPDYTEGMTQVLNAYTPLSWQALLAGFGLGVVPGYKPACTYCGANPIIGNDAVNYWGSHVFLSGIAVTSVTATSVRFTDPVVSWTTGMPPTTKMIPISSHYGLRSVLAVEP